MDRTKIKEQLAEDIKRQRDLGEIAWDDDAWDRGKKDFVGKGKPQEDPTNEPDPQDSDGGGFSTATSVPAGYQKGFVSNWNTLKTPPRGTIHEIFRQEGWGSHEEMDEEADNIYTIMAGLGIQPDQQFILYQGPDFPDHNDWDVLIDSLGRRINLVSGDQEYWAMHDDDDKGTVYCNGGEGTIWKLI